MSRSIIIQTVATIWLTAFVFGGAEAQQPQYYGSAAPVFPGYQPITQVRAGAQPALLPTNAYQSMNGSSQAVAQTWQPHPGQMINAYPQTGAALYPSPVPNVPHQVGGAMITNQALHPHEMLYPHRYKAMYPPFYYVNKGHWCTTPWGVRSSDVWTLTGTKVDVKYRSKYSFLSGFHGFDR